MDGRTRGHAVHPPNDDAAKGSVSAFRDIRHNEPIRTRVIRRESNRTRTIAKLRDEMRQIPSERHLERHLRCGRMPKVDNRRKALGRRST